MGWLRRNRDNIVIGLCVQYGPAFVSGAGGTAGAAWAAASNLPVPLIFVVGLATFVLLLLMWNLALMGLGRMRSRASEPVATQPPASSERSDENPDDKHFECLRHVQWCDIRPVTGTEEATIEVTTWRQMRNTSDQTRVMMLGLAIDDFDLASGHSRIENVAYRIGGNQWVSVVVDLVPSGPHTRVLQPQTIPVPGQTIIDVEARYVEAKRSNDAHVIQYRIPTVDPLVIVKTIYQHSVSFSKGVRAASTSPDGAYWVRGRLESDQAITIRWWPGSP